MSILRNLIDSILATTSNEAFEMVKMRELETQVIDAIKDATKDGTITAKEMADISSLVQKLSISSEEFNHVRLGVLENLVDSILADGKVLENEMELLKEVEDSINVSEHEPEELKAKIEKVKQLAGKA